MLPPLNTKVKCIIIFIAASGRAYIASFLTKRVTDQFGKLRTGTTFLPIKKILKLFQPAHELFHHRLLTCLPQAGIHTDKF
jgi:hypothetical protein